MTSDGAQTLKKQIIQIKNFDEKTIMALRLEAGKTDRSYADTK